MTILEEVLEYVPRRQFGGCCRGRCRIATVGLYTLRRTVHTHTILFTLTYTIKPPTTPSQGEGKHLFYLVGFLNSSNIGGYVRISYLFFN